MYVRRSSQQVGIPDREWVLSGEWERSGYRLNSDHDDIPNFYDTTDDDNDSLSTSVELSADLNPFNAADTHGDKDSDGLDNLWEYKNGTMINDADTDHDGITDGAEFEYWQERLYDEWNGWYNENGAGVNETAVEYLKNPDVDKDNVTDGKEINGWTVKIIVGYDEDNKPISKEVTLYGDPLAPYKDPNGEYIDADEDNIPDIVESLLSNNSTFVKFAEWALSNDLALWRAYNWTIAYFFSVRNYLSFSSIVEELNDSRHNAKYIINAIRSWESARPHSKSCAENATKWLQDEFNPLITESMAPVITDFNVVTYQNGWIVWPVPNMTALVSFNIYDVAGISKIRIKSICPDITGIRTWTVIIDVGGVTHYPVDKLMIDITEVSAVLTYNISVNATDTLGNSAEWYKEVNGPIGVVIKTIAKALAMFWDFLCEVGSKIAEAIQIVRNFVIDTLVNIFSGLRGIIETIIQRGKDFYTGKVDLLSAITFGLSLSAIAGRVMLIGLSAFAFALLFLASTIITMDDFIYAEMVGLMGFGATSLFSHAMSLYNSQNINLLCNLNEHKKLISGETGLKYIRFGTYIAVEPSVYSGTLGVWISGGPGIQVNWIFGESSPQAYTYIQTPTPELSPLAYLDVGLTIELSSKKFESGMKRASFSLRLLNIGVGIPTESDEYGYIDIGILEYNLFVAFQWSQPIEWQYTGSIVGGE